MALSTRPLKGMLDDFPEDMAQYHYLRNIIEKLASDFHYGEYDAPVMENIELFREAKNDELVKEQAYHLSDKGGREIILRPEMTRSLARMIASVAKERPRPYRWYSIPKCYRYERPQKGRLREFRQLNFDLLGENSMASDLEMLELVHTLMKRFKVPEASYTIKLNHRGLLQYALTNSGFDEAAQKQFYHLVDRKNKLSTEDFGTHSKDLFNEAQIKILQDYLKLKDYEALIDWSASFGEETAMHQGQKSFHQNLLSMDFSTQCHFSPEVVRGLEYYTGLVFEVNSLVADIHRALFGGGRYDDLCSMFGSEAVSGIGFGMGIYIFSLFLEAQGLMPQADELKGEKRALLHPMSEKECAFALRSARKLRELGYSAEISLKPIAIKKVFQRAEQRKLDYVAILGEEELNNQKIELKSLKGGEKESIAI